MSNTSISGPGEISDGGEDSLQCPALWYCTGPRRYLYIIHYLFVQQTKENADYCLEEVTHHKINVKNLLKILGEVVSDWEEKRFVRCDKFSTLGLIIPPEKGEGGHNVASLSGFL